MKRHPASMKDEIREQLAAGRSQREISQEYGLSRYRIQSWGGLRAETKLRKIQDSPRHRRVFGAASCGKRAYLCCIVRCKSDFPGHMEGFSARKRAALRTACPAHNHSLSRSARRDLLCGHAPHALPAPKSRIIAIQAVSILGNSLLFYRLGRIFLLVCEWEKTCYNNLKGVMLSHNRRLSPP